MMTFSAVYEYNSKAFPGVTVKLRRMGRKRRGGVELQIAQARAKCREHAQTCARIDGQIQGALDAIPGYREKLQALPHDDKGNLIDELPADLLKMIPPEVWKMADERATAKSQSAALENAEIYPAFILAAVESIEGIEGGCSAEQLCEAGPDKLFDEVVSAINENAYLTVEQTENL